MGLLHRSSPGPSSTSALAEFAAGMLASPSVLWRR